jgi:predicted nucleotidyltransferase
VPASNFQPKDFIETDEGLIFAVVTNDLEDQRILSSLRYRRTDTGYRKLSTREAEELLKTHHPHYRYYSAIRDVWLHGVHHHRVVRHHQPRQRLQELHGSSATEDPIESKLQRLSQLFENHGLDLSEMGITGSLLIGAQRHTSDIDLVFYQREAFFKAREIIKTLIAKQRLQPLDDKLWQDAYDRRGCALTYQDYRWHEQRKYNKAAIEQTKFDISLLTPAPWWDLVRYRKQGRIKLQSTITDDSRRFDYPARYTVNHPSIKEVISYTATYAGQALRGESVEIQGQLEVSAVGHLRMVIGTNREASNEYIKVLQSQNR